MPWVNEEMCVGCGICVEECPVGAMSLSDGKAQIDDEKCIRCARCHDVCPEGAVRHDSERIPQEVEANVAWAMRLLENFHTPEERRAFIERIKRHFAGRRKVAEQTIERLDAMGTDL